MKLMTAPKVFYSLPKQYTKVYNNSIKMIDRKSHLQTGRFLKVGDEHNFDTIYNQIKDSHFVYAVISQPNETQTCLEIQYALLNNKPVYLKFINCHQYCVWEEYSFIIQMCRQQTCLTPDALFATIDVLQTWKSNADYKYTLSLLKDQESEVICSHCNELCVPKKRICNSSIYDQDYESDDVLITLLEFIYCENCYQLLKKIIHQTCFNLSLKYNPYLTKIINLICDY